MERQEGFASTLKRHKRWADIGSIISTVLMIGLLCVAAYIADITNADESSRIGMYIAMVGVVVAVCIWQAAALVAATIEHVFRQLEQKTPRDR